MASITRFYALILSTILLLSGVPGFFPNITSFQPLITFFALTLVHAVVHAAAGLLGLLITALASDDSVRIYTFGISLLYGILAGVGLIGVNFGSVLTFNSADNWLHGAIFALSLGVFVAGVAEERLHQRTRRISEGLPAGRWAVPSAPVDSFTEPAPSTPFAPSRRTNAPSSPLANRPSGAYPGGMGGAGEMGENGQAAWPNQPPREPAPQNPWAASPQTPWGAGQSSSPQPPANLWAAGQPGSPARDPWTREQRRTSTPPPTQPAAPANPSSGSQQPGNPWSLYPPQQEQWPQSPPPQSPWPPDSQPSQNPWSHDSQARDSQTGNSQPRGDQWPLDEWPSLRDSRPPR